MPDVLAIHVPDQHALNDARAEVRRFHAEGGQPGLAFGVIAGGRAVLTGGLGELRAGSRAAPRSTTAFRIASMTKSFTAATLLLLRDDGMLRLDDAVADHVPEYAAVTGPTRDSPRATVRDLLTMTAGLPTDDPWGDRQQGLDPVAFGRLLRGGLSLAWAPGTAFEYSNLGYAVLGRVIEATTGLPFRDVVTSRLLKPLGLRDTRFEAGEYPPGRLATGHRTTDGAWVPVPFDGHGAFAPMGGLFSTVDDLSRWVAGLAAAFPPRDAPEGDHPLSRASRRELQQPHRAMPPMLMWPSLDAPPRVRVSGYGYGLMVEHDRDHGTVISHSGGYPGFGSHMRWHPQTGFGIVVLANSTYAGAYRLADRMLSVLLAAKDGPPHGFHPLHRFRVGPGRRPRQASAPQPAPGGHVAWPHTLQAQARVERLLARWDDAEAADLFADNVDLDEPLDRRRAELERARALLGPLRPDAGQPVEHTSPAHARWWLRGDHGRLRVEILLTPQRPPRVQTLSLAVVPDPGPRLRAVVDRLVAHLAAACPTWPDDLATTVDLDRDELTRLLRIAAVWAGPCDVTSVTSVTGANGDTGTGEQEATFRLSGERAALSLTVGLQPDAEGTGVPTVRRFAVTVET